MTDRKFQYLLNWRDTIISESAQLRDCIKAISSAGVFMACVTDDQDKLIGIVTDSDVRRALLSGANLEEPAAQWIQRKPVVCLQSDSEEDMLRLATEYKVRELPIVDDQHRLVDIYALLIRQTPIPTDINDPTRQSPPLPSDFIIMAGGKGTRLRSVVSDRPKPLALVGNKPIMETIIRQAASCGFRDITITTNYMSEKIEDFVKSNDFGDCSIRLVEEPKPLGTAGAIGLCKLANSTEPFLVTNGDLITTVPYDAIVQQHKSQGAAITCCVREYKSQVPFGVVATDGDAISGITEKPMRRDLVLSGIYVVDAKMIEKIPADTKFDMPDLVHAALDAGLSVQPFYMHEYWLDVGRPDDFHKANKEYQEVFGDKS